MSNVFIIGGGASGLISAIFARKSGNNVTIFEKNEKLGKKIYITGKGRCNLTNNCEPNEYLNNVVTNKKFMYSAIFSFSPEQTISFFNELGLNVKTERGNRVFPESDKASDVTKVLQKEIEKNNINIKLNEKVLDILVENNKICGIKTNKGSYSCDKVIICTGGASYPLTGSTGDGYAFAKKMGHTIIDIKPSLVGINLAGDFYKEFQGISLKNVTFSIKNGQKLIYSEFGEMLFTHFGISGPIVLTASALINRIDIKQLDFYIDFKPALSNEVLDKRIQREITENNLKSINNCLRSLLPQALISQVVKKSQIKQNKTCSEITKEERERLVTTLKNFSFKGISLRPIDEAIITSGGVSVKDINPKTMESRIISGLYFSGEVIDVDCFTGGFNLQTAFSTGYIAGNNC